MPVVKEFTQGRTKDIEVSQIRCKRAGSRTGEMVGKKAVALGAVVKGEDEQAWECKEFYVFGTCVQA